MTEINEVSLNWSDAYNWFRDLQGGRTRWVDHVSSEEDFIEARVDGERVGLLVAESSITSSVHIIAVGVIEEYRQAGIATELMEYALNEYEEIYCDVEYRNTASQNLMVSLGLELDQYQPSGPVTRYTS